VFNEAMDCERIIKLSETDVANKIKAIFDRYKREHTAAKRLPIRKILYPPIKKGDLI